MESIGSNLFGKIESIEGDCVECKAGLKVFISKENSDKLHSIFAAITKENNNGKNIGN